MLGEVGRWRTRSLLLAAPLLWLIAGLSVWVVIEEFRDLAINPDLQAAAHPIWYHSDAVLRTLSRILCAAGATLAIASRLDEHRSRRVLWVCWLLAMVCYLLPALVPYRWHYRDVVFEHEESRAIVLAALPLFVVGVTIDLVPVIPSVCVAFARAGLRVIRAVPGATGIGAFTVMVAALLMVLSLTTVIAILAPLVHEEWTRWGIRLIALHYAIATWCGYRLLVLPTRARTRQVLRASACTLLFAGIGVLLYGISAIEIEGSHLVAIGGRPGLVTPVYAVNTILEFAARATLGAVVAFDMIWLAVHSGSSVQVAQPGSMVQGSELS